MRLVCLEEVVGSGEDVVYTRPAGVNQQCCRDSASRRHTAEYEAFLDVLTVSIPGGNTGALLCCVINQPAHLLGVQPSRAGGSRGSTEDPADTVRAFVGLKHPWTQSDEETRSDVVAQDHRAQEMRATD